MTTRTIELAIVFAFAALLALYAAACVSQVRTAPVSPTSTPWCLLLEQRGETGRICTQSRDRCEWAARGVRRYGHYSGVTRVDECVYSEEE